MSLARNAEAGASEGWSCRGGRAGGAKSGWGAACWPAKAAGTPQERPRPCGRLDQGQTPWTSQDAAADDAAARRSESGSNEAPEGGFDGRWQAPWNWDEIVVARGSTVRVEASGVELGDSDLPELLRHLGGVLQRCAEQAKGKYRLDIDLSCNRYLSDDGVSEHLAPFLARWPACQRLKLYKTAVGDGALTALSPWIASGHACELHLSDLGGSVTGEAVLALLEEVHQQGNYPYLSSDGARCALWLRLEHNAVPRTDELVGRARAAGLALAVLGKHDLGRIRPGAPLDARKGAATAVNLVLFHMQELRVSRSWLEGMRLMTPVSEELRELVGSSYGPPEPSRGSKTPSGGSKTPSAPSGGSKTPSEESFETLKSSEQAKSGEDAPIGGAADQGCAGGSQPKWASAAQAGAAHRRGTRRHRQHYEHQRGRHGTG